MSMDWNVVKEMADERKRMLLKAMDHKESYSGRNLMVIAGVFTLVGIIIGLMCAPSRKRITIKSIFGSIGGEALQQTKHSCGRHGHGGHHESRHHGCCSGQEDGGSTEDDDI